MALFFNLIINYEIWGNLLRYVQSVTKIGTYLVSCNICYNMSVSVYFPLMLFTKKPSLSLIFQMTLILILITFMQYNLYTLTFWILI